MEEGKEEGLEFFYRFFVSLYLCIWDRVKESVFLLRFLLTIYGDFVFDPVARLVGWRVNLRVNLHYPGMEFPIAVVAREIAAYWRVEGQWQILMGIWYLKSKMNGQYLN